MCILLEEKEGDKQLMKTEKHGYESPNVEKVVANVRAGIRSKADLEYCGCPICKAALRVLGDEG